MKKIALSALFLVSACASVASYGAADDILELVTGLQNNNAAMIERHIDRNALKSQMMVIARDYAIKRAADKIGRGIGAQVAAITAVDLLKPVIEAIADEALRPENLSFFARKAGLTQNLNMPSRFRASLALDAIGENRVCVPDPVSKNCLLYFGKYSDGWRLNQIDENAIKARLDKIDVDF